MEKKGTKILLSREEPEDEFQKFLQTLPKERNWEGTGLCLYQGFWYTTRALRPVICFQEHFQARDTDIILASFPKSGTTWLKSLSFSIINRNLFPLRNSPLLTTSPHDLVRVLEYDLYLKTPSPDLGNIHDPRMFNTHVPYDSLPPSIRFSNCKIVYLCRNPLDFLVSHWHFCQKIPQLQGEPRDPLSLEEGLDKFCQGISTFGPFWDHLLGYWTVSLKRPNNVLFLKYEDLKTDIIMNIKKMAVFLGVPITEEEEKEGVMEEIARLCGFENLKNLEVNETGKRPFGIPNGAFFRKGEMGDWVNYITPSMAENIEKLVEEKLCGSGLTFRR